MDRITHQWRETIMQKIEQNGAKDTNGNAAHMNVPADPMPVRDIVTVIESLKDRRKDNVENARTMLMRAVVMLRKDEELDLEISGVPGPIRRAGGLVNEAWQCVNGASGAIHDAIDAFAPDWCDGEPDAEGVQKLFAALSSLRLAAKYLTKLAEGGAS
jgi:hypothetical protein